MKKIKGFLAVLTAACCFSAGCVSNADSSPSAGASSDTAINATELSLYEVVRGTSSATNLADVQWTSSNSSVLVVEDGVLVAVGEGTATVTAEYNGKKEEFSYTVTDNGIRPIINADDLTLSLDADFSFNPAVYFGAEVIEEAVFTFSVADESVVKIENGKINPKAYGTTTLDIKVTCGGVEKYLEKTINVTVKEDVGIYPMKTAFNLYAIGKMGEFNFPTESELSAYVYRDGELVENANVQWTVADETVAKVENGALKAVGLGKTTVIASCTYADGKTVATQALPVCVNPAYVNGNEYVVVDLTQAEAQIDFSDVFDAETQVEKILLADGQTEYTLNSNKISTNGILSGSSKAQFIMSEGKAIYECNLVFADYVIENEEDFLSLGEYNNCYVALATDVDLSGSAYNPPDFTGVFDGCGHTVSGLVAKRNKGGLFQAFWGVLKNTAVIVDTLADCAGGVFYMDIVYSEVQNSGGTYARALAKQATDNKETFYSIDNVYIQVKQNLNTLSNYSAGLARQMLTLINMRNVIIDMVADTYSTNGFISGYSSGIINFDNCYLIGGNTQVCGEREGIKPYTVSGDYTYFSTLDLFVDSTEINITAEQISWLYKE